MVDTKSAERQFLMERLHEAVKQSQIQFGGKTELATDSDSRVSVLCAAWENVLQHGLKSNSRAISAVKQLSEVTGLKRIGSSIIEDIKNIEAQLSFWACIKELLTAHELQRYNILHHINTDVGRARAWLRASLNERTLERSIHRLTCSSNHLANYYENWSYLRDAEKSAILPNMAAGLGSILFAICIDRPELNSTKPVAGLSSLLTRSSSKPINVKSTAEDQCPVASSSLDSPSVERRKDRQKKKKPPKIVSFDTDDTGASSSPALSVVSPSSSVAGGNSVWTFSGFESDTSRQNITVQVCDSSTNFAPNSDRSEHRTAESNGFSRMSLSKNGESTLGSANSSQTELCTETTRNQSVLNHTANINRSDLSSDHPAVNNPSVNLELTTDQLSDCNLDDLDYCSSRQLTDVKAADTESIGSINSNTSSSSNLLAGQTLVDVGDSSSTLLPVGVDGFPLSLDTVSLCDTTSESYGSYESHDMPAYGELMQGASLAVAEVQHALNNRGLWVDGDNSSATVIQDSLSSAELKEAIVAMMLRKEEIEEQNKRLKVDLQNEKSLVVGLRSEIEELTQSHAAQLEKCLEKNKTVTRENDLLKRQLKKYVSAVQLLRHQGATTDDFRGVHIDILQPLIPPRTSHIDYSEEALDYEKKLVQVAEMHGELMEFNEFLQRQLLGRETQLKHLTDELTMLRGPLSSDVPAVEDELISLGWESDSASLMSTDRPLINVWIPSAFLRGSQLEGYHVYQIYVRIRNEEWNTYRRYAEFYELHSKLKKRNAIFSTFDFPPKKAFGKKDPKIVEIRRKKLQSYLRHVIAQLSRDVSILSTSPCRQTLTTAIPFFSDAPPGDRNKRRSRHSHMSRGVNIDNRLPSTSATSAPQYMGL